MLKRIFYTILKYFFTILLITTALGKLLDNRGFAHVIDSYQFHIPQEFLLPLALFISFFELSLGVSVFQEKRRKFSATFLILVHTGYSALALVTLTRGIPLTNCGCFGVFWARPMSWMTFAEDVILTLLSIIFYFLL